MVSGAQHRIDVVSYEAYTTALPGVRTVHAFQLHELTFFSD